MKLYQFERRGVQKLFQSSMKTTHGVQQKHQARKWPTHGQALPSQSNLITIVKY